MSKKKKKKLIKCISICILSAQTQQKQTIFQKNDERWWKIDCLQQYEKNNVTVNNSKSQSASKVCFFLFKWHINIYRSF